MKTTPRKRKAGRGGMTTSFRPSDIVWIQTGISKWTAFRVIGILSVWSKRMDGKGKAKP